MFGTFVEMSLDKPLFAFFYATFFFCNRRAEKYARGYVAIALDAINWSKRANIFRHLLSQKGYAYFLKRDDT